MGSHSGKSFFSEYQDSELPSITRSFVFLLCISIIITCVIPDRFLISTDSLFYIAAAKLFFSGQNPYDPALMQQLQYDLSNSQHWGMVWNPPSFFVILGWLYLLPLELLMFCWVFIYLSAAIVTAYCGAQLASETPKNPWTALFFPVLLSSAVWRGLEHGQNSLLIMAITALASLLFIKGKNDILCGCLLSCAALKPHLCLLPATLVVIAAVRSRRLKLLGGLFAAIAIEFSAASLINQRIISHWIHRTAWPWEVGGSTLVSFLRFNWPNIFGEEIMFIIPFLALGSMLIITRGRLTGLTGEDLVLAWALTPIVAPYGFIFDQAGSVLVQSFILTLIWENGRRSRIIFFLAVISSFLTAHLADLLAEGFFQPSWLIHPMLLFLVLVLIPSAAINDRLNPRHSLQS